MLDPTEPYRRQRLAEINAQPGSREALEAEHRQVWNTEELMREFQVIGFLAPYVVVRRRSDGKKGSARYGYKKSRLSNPISHKRQFTQ